MIKVSITKDKIIVSGHACYDEYGKDIVCAAVSATVLTTINGILSINKSSINVIEGNELIIEIKEHNEITDKLINNMIKSLKEIEKDYSKYINIQEEV
jgi:uncharacterized protein YsxB (DUF464 family)